MTVKDATDTGDRFTAALAQVQADLPRIVKDQAANTGKFSYTFANLATISPAVLPLLASNGFAWVTKPLLDEAHNFVLNYKLRHVSGEAEEGNYPLPDPSRSTPQEIGSAITYSRRYALCSVLGIAPSEDDDDAQSASQVRPPAVDRKAPARTNGRAAPAPVPEPEPVDEFAPTPAAVELMADVLNCEDPVGAPPEGVVIEQWMWQLAGEPNLDVVPWDKVLKKAGVRQVDAIDRAKEWAGKLGLPEPDHLNDIHGPLAVELRRFLLTADTPF